MKPIPLHLRRLAALYDLQCSYTDVRGVRTQATEGGIIAVLASRGIDAQSEDASQQAINQRIDALSDRHLEPVHVVWGSRDCTLPFRAPATKIDSLIVTLKMENGEHREIETSPHRDDGDAVQLSLGRLPFGYHDLEVKSNGRTYRSKLFSAPERAWSSADRDSALTRGLGLFAPIYALRSKRNWGVGDFTDASALLSWSRTVGSSMIGTLPLLATFLDKPFDPSPYAPVSRLFWNELFVNVESLPELAANSEARRKIAEPSFQRRLQNLRDTRLVDYAESMSCKREILLELSRSLPHAVTAELNHFAASTPLLRDYAEFRGAVDKLGSSWQQWPEPQRRGSLSPDDYDEVIVRYHLYVQWCVHRQLSLLASEARSAGQGLYLDYPLGTHADGYDVWRYQSVYARGASVGAPPDISFQQGQNWGFTPLEPERLRESGYELFIAAVRNHLRYAGTLRIDHVMGLHRMWWIGHGQSPARGVYVRYRADELYAIFNIESHRSKTEIVGEDLGTVPSYVRTSMDQRGYRRLFVLQRQFTHVADPPGPVVPNMLASMNNHDMFPFAGFWGGVDIDEKHAIGIIKPERLEPEREKRAHVRMLMIRFLEATGTLTPNTDDPASIHNAALDFLSRSTAGTMLVNLEDLWLETEAQNIPTTTFERPNWRQKFQLDLESIASSKSIADQLSDLMRKRAGPA